MDDNSRILIVDDVEENLKVLTDTLTGQGFHPLQAKNGERAIKIAQKAMPDLILLDIQMPGMNGYETIAELKSIPEVCDIPVIFISALNQIEDKVKGFNSGAVDYVSKPFQKEEVIARVTTHLKLRQVQREIEREKEKSEALLRNVLPEAVANELKQTGKSEPQSFKDVSILFSDIVQFTSCSSNLKPRIIIDELNDIFSAFDDIMEKNGCERIKTIGDAYMAVCGVPNHDSEHAIKLTKAALEMIDYVAERKNSNDYKWDVRIGIHSGDVVGGIVGNKKYIYDIFGDTVNTASRMESNSKSMSVNISEDTYNLISSDFKCTKRDPIEVKGKGLTKMYYVEQEL